MAAVTNPSVVLRPVRRDEGPALWSLLADHGDELVGMTALPHDEAHAEELASRSAKTVLDLAAGRFQLDRGESGPVHFVLVETTDRGDRLVGVTGVTPKNGVLNLAVHIRTSDDGSGLIARSSSVPWSRTELNSTFLGPEGRGRGLGTLLSRGRFLYLLLAASQIPSLIVAHVRGVFDADGTAPFWRVFGSRFLPEWPTSADAERALQDDPERIAALSRRTIELVPEVMRSLGPVNAASRPAFHLLRQEDLRPNGMYDPVDGGPTLVRPLTRTTSAAGRVVGPVVIGVDLDPGATAAARPAAGVTTHRGLVSRLALADFAAAAAEFAVVRSADADSTQIVLTPEVAATLGLRSGDGAAAVSLETADSVDARGRSR